MSPLCVSPSSSMFVSCDVVLLMHGRSRSLAAQSNSGGDGPLTSVKSCFGPKCLNTTLHVHLESKHMVLYVTKLEEEGWQVRSPLLRAAFLVGHSYSTLKAALAHPNVMINNLPPPPI